MVEKKLFLVFAAMLAMGDGAKKTFSGL